MRDSRQGRIETTVSVHREELEMNNEDTKAPREPIPYEVEPLSFGFFVS
jgi:hypothetical protein